MAKRSSKGAAARNRAIKAHCLKLQRKLTAIKKIAKGS